MYPVSNDYKEAMHARAQRFQVTGTVGDVLFNDENILTGSLSITNQCSSDDNIEIGQVYIGELNCTFINLNIDRYGWYGKDITIYFGQMLANGSYETIPLGIYTISEAEYTASGVVVKAYDHMAKLDKACSELIAGAKPYNLALKICQKCGLTFETTETEFQTFANSDTVFSAYNENDIETYRDALSWVAQACGCFATASRTGGIIFRAYNSQAVETIDDHHRFTGCSFSDFSTRYTGMSVVNMDTQTTTYYYVKPDDALTYNLGSNPYLQIPVSHSLTTMRRNILNVLAEINFTPFKAICIGNPAYDLGDVLIFSDGIADDTKKSCITKFVWNYGSNYEMTGSGRNPALASASSKSDKNIAGLISRTSENKLLQYVVLRNREEIQINDGSSGSVLLAQYISSQGSHIRFNFEILLTAIPDDESVIIRAKYFLDNNEVTDRYPIETWETGKHILTLQYDISNADDGAHSLDLQLEVSGGKILIEKNDAYEVLTSTGIFSDNVWEGTVRGEDGNLYIIIDGVAHKVPDSIEVAIRPSKTVYMDDEPIDYTGLVINAVFGDETKTDITADCELNPSNGTPYSADRDNYIEVTYFIMGLEYSTGFELGYNGIIRIEMASLPDKVNYKQGEAIDYTGARVRAVYYDGSTEDVTEESIFIPGDGTTFNYNELKAKTGLKTLAVTSPDKTVYAEGDILDYSGCEIWAYYEDGSYQNVTNDAVFSPEDGELVTSATRDKVSVSYTNSNGEETSSSFRIATIRLKSITVSSSAPVSCKAGEPISYADVNVRANYTDGSMRDVKELAVFTPAEGSIAESTLKSVVVKYSDAAGNTKTDLLPVKMVYLTSLKATRPRKYEYRYGENISYAGTTVTATYSDGTVEDVTDNVIFSPSEGETVTRSTPESATVSYTNAAQETTSTDIELTIITLQSLQISKLPDKTAYNIGENLSLTGVEVRAFYSDSSWDNVTNDCTFRPEDGAELSASNSSVSVSYMNAYFEAVSTSFAIAVGKHVLTGLRITPPDKHAYKYGESIDYSGLEVTAVYFDGENEEVTSYVVISPPEGSIFTTTQDISVIVSYTDSANDTATAAFTLNYVGVASIAVMFNPSKTTYIIGQAADYTGCLIRAVYSDGSIPDITSLCTFSPSQGTILTTTGIKTVTVSYAQMEAFFNITVEANTIKSLSITDSDTNIYSIGDTWDFSSVSIRGIYTDGTSEDVTASCVFSPADGTAITEDGDIPITVTCGGLNAVFFRAAVGYSDFLNYVNYTKSDTEMSIRITGLKFSAIGADTDIVIYSKIQQNNKIYDVIIDD